MTNEDPRVPESGVVTVCIWVGPVSGSQDLKRVGLAAGDGGWRLGMEWAHSVSWGPPGWEEPGQVCRLWLPRGGPGEPGLSHSAGDI